MLRLAVIAFANILFCARFGIFYVVLIPAAASIDFFIGLGLMNFKASFVRRLLLGISLILNLGLLIGTRHMGAILDYARPSDHWDWIFPLGLSFYTFQALTYTIDLYRRDSDGTTSILAHLASVSFFPPFSPDPSPAYPTW